MLGGVACEKQTNKRVIFNLLSSAPETCLVRTSLPFLSLILSLSLSHNINLPASESIPFHVAPRGFSTPPLVHILLLLNGPFSSNLTATTWGTPAAANECPADSE